MYCHCYKCRLQGKPRVLGALLPKSQIKAVLIGEAPGREEEFKGKPFVGKSGAELNQYIKLSPYPLLRSQLYIDNAVSCRPDNNETPGLDIIKCCLPHIKDILNTYRVPVIGTVGAISTKLFLPGLDMERAHGIPFKVNELFDGTVIEDRIIVPIYHPAWALHDATENMAIIRKDIEVFTIAVKFGGKVDYWEERKVEKDYRLMSDPGEVKEDLEGCNLISIDTEFASNKPWCLTYSNRNDTGRMIVADNIESIEAFNTYMPDTVIVHNAAYDVNVLRDIGVSRINEVRIEDTMIQSYLPQVLPQGLKPLAFRLLNTTMKSYEDVTSKYTDKKVIDYLIKVIAETWPKPDPVLEKKPGGQFKVRQPQPIQRRVLNILNKVTKGTVKDLWGSWVKIRGDYPKIEQRLGVLYEGNLADADFTEALNYACQDADMTYMLWPKLNQEIEEKGLRKAYEADLNIILILSDMMRVGWRLDRDKLQDISYRLEHDMMEMLVKMQAEYGILLNPNSSKEVLRILKELGVMPDSGTSADESHLNAVAHKHKIVQDIIDYRKLLKLKTTYADKLYSGSESDGRIYTSISMTRTITGRLATKRPNLMGIPSRSERGREIRKCFIADPGCKLVIADYSQIEMRVVAHESKDKIMCKIFEDGLDIHAQTASKMFHLPVEQLDKELHRRPAKNVGFGVVYCIGAEGLLTQMIDSGAEGWTIDTCQRLIDDWFRVYEGVAEFMGRKRMQARALGYVTDMFGRRRNTPEVNSSIRGIVNAGYRYACNTPIQSGAQGIIKRAMGNLRPYYIELEKRGKYKCRPLLQVHDELIFEVSEEIVEVAEVVIREVMEQAVELRVPVIVDCKIEECWDK